MDINKHAEDILSRNIKPYRELYFLPEVWLKYIIKKHILRRGGGKIVVYGYQNDADRFMTCLPPDCSNVKCVYARREDWLNRPGKEFHHPELIVEIAKYEIDKLVIVSDDLRYLLQMLLMNENISYEIVDIYELIKRLYKTVIVGSIATPLKDASKEYIKQLRMPGQKKYCDNYDAIVVKKYRAKKAVSKKEKQYYLRELIISYLLIKDYKTAFFYIDCYTRLTGKRNNPFIRIKQEFLELFSQMKRQLRAREQKDIIVFWCDALPHSDFKKYHFLEDVVKDSMVFEKAYTHVPYTHTTIQAMFTGVPFFEGKMYRNVETPNMIRQSKTIDLLRKNCYQIGEVGAGYIKRKFAKMPNYSVRCSYPPASMELWETLAQLLKDENEKKFIICHMDGELHNPFWNGKSERLLLDPGRFLGDVAEYENQIKESARYVEEQILYYLDFLGENTCKIFMSDHGIGAPAYAERRLHAFCFVSDHHVKKGNFNEYFSYLKFYELLNYILHPTEDNLRKIFSEYVLIQNDHPYSEKYSEEILGKLKNKEDIRQKDWMGFRGIIKNGYKLVRYPQGEEIWYDPADNEIEPEDIQDRELVQFMRDMAGHEFPDIYAEQHYIHTRKLYEKLQLDFKTNR